MIVFVCFLLLILQYVIKSGSGDTKRARLIFVRWSLLILILVSGLRNFSVGVDTYSYIYNYQHFNMSFDQIFNSFWDLYLNPGVEGKDPGFNIFQKVLSSVSKDVFFFQFIVTSVLLIPLGYFFYSNIRSIDGILLGFIFYITSYYVYLPMASARQSLALAFVCIGAIMLMKHLNMKGILLFIAFSFMASTFHKSALVSMIIIPFLFYKDLKKIYIGAILVFVLMLFYYPVVGSFLVSTSDIYSVYAEADFYGRSAGRPYAFLTLTAFIFCICFRNILKSNNHTAAIVYSGSACAVVLAPLALMDPTMMRILSYLGIWTCLVLSDVCVDDEKKKNKMFLITLSILLLRAIVSPFHYAFFWETY